MRPSSFRVPRVRRRASGFVPLAEKVRALLICAAHQSPFPHRFEVTRRRGGSARNDALGRRFATLRPASRFASLRFIALFSASAAMATVRATVLSRERRRASIERGANAAEKKFAKLLTQKKCVASFRRNASHITTSDPNEPPSALRTRRTRPNGSGPGRAVRLPPPQCRGPLSRNCPARPRTPRRPDASARRESAANRIRAGDPAAAGLSRRPAPRPCLCYWASDTRHYAKPLTRSEPWLSRKLRKKPPRKR